MVVFNNIIAGASGATSGAAAGFKIDRSLRFNSADSAYLNRTPSSAGNRKTWTLSGWVKRGNLGEEKEIFDANNGSDYTSISFTSNDELRVYFRISSTNYTVTTSQVFRDPSAWMHIVVAVSTTESTASDRCKLYVNGSQISSFSSTGYPPQNGDTSINATYAHFVGGRSGQSRYFNGYLADVQFVDGQALAATDFGEYDDNNVWQPKEFTGSYTSPNTSTTLSQTGWAAASEDNIWDGNTSTQSNGYNGGTIGTVSFSPALTNVTKVEVYQQNYVHYLNGSQVTTSQTGTGWHTLYDSSSPITLSSVGNAYTNNTQTVDIMAIRINDSVVDSKTWTPPSGVGVQSGGLNSFYLKFADNSSTAALGTDSSGLSNTYTVNNLSVASGAGNDSLIDTPTNYESAVGNAGGNYATMNPLDKDANCTLSNGNLDVSCSTSGWFGANATMEVIAGKTYFEATYVSGSYVNIGLNTPNTGVGDVNTDGVHLQNDNGTWRVRNGSSTASISAVSANSVIGVAVDTSANTIQFFVNGTSVYSGTLNALHRIPMVYGYGTYNVVVNFGQRPFAHTPPTGYKSLCTQNLANPTIADGSTAMDVALYTGNGTSQSITGLGFSPDFVWVKNRAEAVSHFLFDAVRGNNNYLRSDGTFAEDSGSTNQLSFATDGFDVSGTGGGVNKNTISFVGWAWDAGTSNTTISAGSLNSATYNQSQTWSGQITGTNYSGYPKTNAFNNDTTNYCLAGQGQELIFTPSPSFSSATTVKIWYYMPTSHANAIKINGTGVASNVATTGGVATHTFTVSGFTSLSWSRGVYASEDVGIARIDVDGVQLVDSGVSMPNFPSINSVVRANPSAGFSVVTWTDPDTGSGTIGHGLNAAPELIIAKSRTAAFAWAVWHKAIPRTHSLFLNSTAASTNINTNYWGTADPTSSVFGVGYTGESNNEGDMIAYCFAPVEGYSAFGKWTGGSDAFVYLGFRPKFLLIKANTAGYDWLLFDSERSTSNLVDDWLSPNLSAAETQNNTVNNLDFLSNGFKIKGTGGYLGTSVDMLYAAFAEHPFKTARAR